MERFDYVVLGAALNGRLPNSPGLYEPFRQLHEADPKAYKAKKREVYQAIMTSVRDLIPDVDRFARMKIFGTPTTSECYLGQPQGNIYRAKLVP